MPDLQVFQHFLSQTVVKLDIHIFVYQFDK